MTGDVAWRQMYLVPRLITAQRLELAELVHSELYQI